MNDKPEFHEAISAEGDTQHFSRDEVTRALLLYIPEDEAKEIAAELYSDAHVESGLMFDESLLSALERLSPDIALRVARLVVETPDEAIERRERFEALLRERPS